MWEVLTDFSSYGRWSNFSSIEGEAKVGERLKMRMPGFAFASTVTVARREEQLEWSASLINATLFVGAHSFTLSTNPEGSTRLINTETFSGALVRPFRRLMARGPQDNGYAAFNRGIKRRVEARHSVPASVPARLEFDTERPRGR